MSVNAEGLMLPNVIVCDERLMRYFRGSLEEFTPPSFWTAADPMARLREIGKEARILLAYGGNAGLVDMLDALPKVGCVLLSGAGYEGVDFDMLKARGIVCANNGPANSEDVADLALGLALTARREIIAGDQMVREGRWGSNGVVTRSFSAMRAGVVGYGHIGKAIARRLDGFGIETRWWSPRPQPDQTRQRADSLLDLARSSDLLMIACPGGDATCRLIDREIIDAVGAEGLIVSVARGSVIDESELIAALKQGRLGAAGLDVFEEEPTPPERWADVPNVVLSPHRGGLSDAAWHLTTSATLDNIRRYLAGEDVLHRLC